MTKSIDSTPNTDETASTAAQASANTSGLLTPLLDKLLLRELRKQLGGDRVRFETIKNEDGTESTAYEQLAAHLAAVAPATTLASNPAPFFGVQFFEREGDESAPLSNANCITLATVGIRDKATSVNGVKAIVAYESPLTGDFFTGTSENALSFVHKVIERESSDVAFAALRQQDMTVADMILAVNQMPTTVDAIVDTSRAGSESIDDAFETLWTPFRRSVLKVKAPKLESQLPTKAEVQKAIRSKAYALANPATKAVEEAKMFVQIANMLIKLGAMFKDSEGNAAPVDTTSIANWLESRETFAIAFAAKEQIGEIETFIDF